jgi:hypothetical protein
MRGEDAESTAIKLPPMAEEADIEVITVRAMDPVPRAVTVRFVRVFCLDGRFYPRMPLAAAPAVCTLSAANPEATVWRRS